MLLVEDEAVTAHPFARGRLTFACAVSLLPRGSAESGPLLAALRAKFGATVDLIASLPDFQVVRLTPERGRLIAGFGEAFEIDPQDWSRLTPIGRPR